MQAWNSNNDSTVVMMAGTRRHRFHVRDFCTDSVKVLRDSPTPVTWALKPMDVQDRHLENSVESQVSTIELLKYLVSQAITIQQNILHRCGSVTLSESPS